MQLLLTVFCIIALVLIISSNSSIFSFKSGNDINVANNTRDPSVSDNSLFLLMDDKSTVFSSLLQTISAQEDDTGEGEEQDKTRGDCGHGEHFDSEVDLCISDEEKEVCDDDKDNDNDSRVDLEDPECLPNDNKQEQQQQDNNGEQEDKDKLVQAPLDNKEDSNNNYGENSVPIEQQDNNTFSNNNVSADSSNTEDKAQNSSQNLTDGHSSETTSTTNNNAPTNELQHANASRAEDGTFSLNCHPSGTKMLPGEEGSTICTIENKTPKSIEMVLECSGLQDTGIECYINGKQPAERILVKQMSSINFSVLLVSRSSPPVLAGSYPFTISANECFNSDLC